MTEAKILSVPESSEYFFTEGCFILELSNSEQDPTVSIARARLTPNTETKLHTLNKTIERYIILQGKGEMQLGSQSPKVVTPNDVVIIPENYPQGIKNIGNNDLIFLVVCTPRFQIENYSECVQ